MQALFIIRWIAITVFGIVRSGPLSTTSLHVLRLLKLTKFGRKLISCCKKVCNSRSSISHHHPIKIYYVVRYNFIVFTKIVYSIVPMTRPMKPPKIQPQTTSQPKCSLIIFSTIFLTFSGVNS